MEQVGKVYERPFEKREVRVIGPEAAAPEEMVKYALLTNAEVEEKYWEWRARWNRCRRRGRRRRIVQLSLSSMIENGGTAWKMTNMGGRGMMR